MITIELPFPPKELMPNAARRIHWGKKSSLSAQYRAECFIRGCRALYQNKGPLPETGKLRTSITFHEPDRRSRDVDGMHSAIKAGLDGIAQALCVDDARFRPVQLDVADEPCKGGKVIVTIETIPAAGVGA